MLINMLNLQFSNRLTIAVLDRLSARILSEIYNIGNKHTCSVDAVTAQCLLGVPIVYEVHVHVHVHVHVYVHVHVHVYVHVHVHVHIHRIFISHCLQSGESSSFIMSSY